MLRFALPGESSRRDVEGFYTEFAAEGTACIGSAVAGDFDVWLANMQDRIAGRNLPAGFVQESFFLCYEGYTLVGVLNFKYTLTEFLLNYGGHIGYAVRPSCQGRGLATQMLRQSLDIGRGMGYDRACCLSATTTTLRRSGSSKNAAACWRTSVLTPTSRSTSSGIGSTYKIGKKFAI